jgi:uncharacterized protein YaaW (UPF0174 family)
MKQEVVEKVSELMTAAFGLIAALAWNEAVKTLFVAGGPLSFVATYGVWIYAIIVTALAVIAIIWIGKLSKKA